jgi:NADH dehydrogenase FAD-containing subunit
MNIYDNNKMFNKVFNKMFNKTTVVGLSSLGGLSIGTYIMYIIYDEISHKYFEKDRQKLIVVGSGFAARNFVNRINTKKYDVTVVSRNKLEKDRSIICPFQPEFIDSMINPSLGYNKWKPSKRVNVCTSTCTSINPEFNTIECINNNGTLINLSYDKIIFAIGSSVNTFGIQGVSECLTFKDEDDVNQLKQMFEKGILNVDSKIAILGAGLVGVELASEIATKCKNVTIIEAFNKILPMLDQNESNSVQEYLLKQGIKIKLEHKVTKIIKEINCSIVSTQNNTSNSNNNIWSDYSYDVIIWTCGIKPNQIKIISSSELEKFSNFDTYNKYNSKQTIYTIGDCTKLNPKSAQNAKQHGIYLANFLNNDLKEGEYVFKNNGIVIRLHDKVFIKSHYITGFFPYYVKQILNYFNK